MRLSFSATVPIFSPQSNTKHQKYHIYAIFLRDYFGVECSDSKWEICLHESSIIIMCRGNTHYNRSYTHIALIIRIILKYYRMGKRKFTLKQEKYYEKRRLYRQRGVPGRPCKHKKSRPKDVPLPTPQLRHNVYTPQLVHFSSHSSSW